MKGGGISSSSSSSSGSMELAAVDNESASAKKMKQREVEEDRSVPMLGQKVSDDVVEDPDGLAFRASQILLDYYNGGVEEYKGRVYELMEVVCSSTIREHNVCTHVNFRAKKKRAANSKAVTFFGELLVRDDNVAMRVCILKPGKSSGSCVGCNPDLVHPPSEELSWYASLRGNGGSGHGVHAS